MRVRSNAGHVKYSLERLRKDRIFLGTEDALDFVLQGLVVLEIVEAGGSHDGCFVWAVGDFPKIQYHLKKAESYEAGY